MKAKISPAPAPRVQRAAGAQQAELRETSERHRGAPEVHEPPGTSAQPQHDADTFRILISTDTHIGFKAADPIRGEDSFNTFEEILKLAKAHHVDLMLHGGDLFEEHKPSRATMHKTMKLFRKYCLGEGSVNFDVVSNYNPNWQDPNINVALPIFIIHGNHDNPGEEAQLSPIDLLEIPKFVNYFGQTADLDNVVVEPILLVKGKTKVE
eukprot:GHVT01079046.1.p1 GENE.GHVT01079046.1~~GHVT01079046.1.p1  ORF type:complete len:209 (+),score=51.30 GHVT01079046.1:297-923(+)